MRTVTLELTPDEARQIASLTSAHPDLAAVTADLLNITHSSEPEPIPFDFISIDIEATGLDVVKDRIISLGVLGRSSTSDVDGTLERGQSWFCNPCRHIPDEVVNLTKITNEEVRNWPKFADQAEEIHNLLTQHRYIVGFNLLNFDVPILWEEFYRAGIEWDTQAHEFIDVGVLFKKQEPRTLAAACSFYLGEEHAGAHQAADDAAATANVLAAMLQRYPELGAKDAPNIAAFSHHERRVDLAGRIILNDAGVPVYNVGKAKGEPVVSNPGMGYWMLERDFPEQTKQVIRRLLDISNPANDPL